MDVPTPAPDTQWREQVEKRFDHVDEQLKAIADRLGLILTVLMPEQGDGPSLDDLLARLATLIAEQRPILRRIDGTTGKSLDILEGRTPASQSDSEGDLS